MYRILIADDEMIERAVLCKRLNEALKGRCEIYQAENGREALRLYREKQIEIMILDIEMPGINGIEAAQKIRAQDKNCCIIFLTAYDEFSYAKKAISVRALDYLLKPYDEQELLLLMEEAMHMVDENRAREAERKRAAEQHRGGSVQGTEGNESSAATVHAEPSAESTDAEAILHGVYTGEDGAPEENVLPKLEVRVKEYIRQNYHRDISVQDIAEALGYSEAYFCRLFKQLFQQNFVSYLTEYRVNEAKRQLCALAVNVKEVSKAVGYADSNYFAKVFKRITGQSPTEYRMHMQEDM